MPGFVVTAQNDEALRRFVQRQAALVINGPVARAQGIVEERLKAFEEAELGYPFAGAG